MDSLFPDSVKAILFGVIVVAFGMNRLARAFPDTAWLQHFRLQMPHLTDEQKARRRRHANLMVGLEIILAAFVLPLLYLLSKVMMFNEPTTVGMFIVGACSLACIGVGSWVIIRSIRG
jgi:hypothetical protein